MGHGAPKASGHVVRDYFTPPGTVRPRSATDSRKSRRRTTEPSPVNEHPDGLVSSRVSKKIERWPHTFFTMFRVEAGDLRRCINASKVRAAIRSLLSLARWKPFNRVETPGNSSARSQILCRALRSKTCLPGCAVGYRSTDTLPSSVGGSGSSLELRSAPHCRGWLGDKALGRRYARALGWGAASSPAADSPENQKIGGFPRRISRCGAPRRIPPKVGKTAGPPGEFPRGGPARRIPPVVGKTAGSPAAASPQDPEKRRNQH